MRLDDLRIAPVLDGVGDPTGSGLWVTVEGDELRFECSCGRVTVAAVPMLGTVTVDCPTCGLAWTVDAPKLSGPPVGACWGAMTWR